LRSGTASCACTTAAALASTANAKTKRLIASLLVDRY
jgi:hypothetical protein